MFLFFVNIASIDYFDWIFQVLSLNINRTPQDQAEASMQHEITKLTTENLDMRIQYDSLTGELKKYKNQCKNLTKKLREAGIPAETSPNPVENAGNYGKSDALPIVRKKETNYLGMFEFSIADEKQITRHLIYGTHLFTPSLKRLFGHR